MSIRSTTIFVVASGLTTLMLALPAQALSMHECSLKYKAAQSAGTLKGMKWNEFRKAECGADAAAAPAPDTATPSPRAPRSAARDTASDAFARTGDAVFPTTVSSKYSNESPGKARMHTCLDQYHANKASGGNGSLKWIQKGGGYYSECNKRLSAR